MNYKEKKEEMFNKETKLTIKQRLEIILNQLIDFKKIIMALIGLSLMPYLNQLLSEFQPIIYFNDIYKKFLTIISANEVPIVKDLNGNIILTCIAYILILSIFLKPYSLQRKAKQCKELGITDNSKPNGNTIIPISEKYNRKTKTKSLKCFSNGIVIQDFEENNYLEKLSKKWNCYVFDVKNHKNDKLIITYKKDKSSRIIKWDNSLLDKADFIIILGIDDMGELKIIDFSLTPSMIIASASGGGKSVLFKNIMLQSYLKGATIIICDFKGGLDFNKGWKNLNKKRCKLMTDSKSLWDYLLYDIHDISVDRTALLNKYECKDIKEFNAKVNNKEIDEPRMERIIIGIDEASEIYAKSKDKEKEKQLEEIRNVIDEIAHLYRAIGIHLMISTQVPSSQVLSEQVRHNAVIRVCGRADKILSKIAIDNENASKIKPNERGRFATGEKENCFFQGFIFDDRKVLDEIVKKEQENN